MIELLDYQETPLGLLCLRRRELLSRPGIIVTEVTLDHVFLMSSYHTESERALASRALEIHQGNDNLEILVGGLGLGFTALEALKDSRTSKVEVIEILPQVIQWLAEGWIPDSEILLNDERFCVTHDDVFKRLLTPAAATSSWDLILLDVDHAPDELLVPENAPFYTAAGLERVRQQLRPGGVLALWSSFPNPEFAELLETVFSQVTVEDVSWWNDLIDLQKEDTLFFARR